MQKQLANACYAMLPTKRQRRCRWLRTLHIARSEGGNSLTGSACCPLALYCILASTCDPLAQVLAGGRRTLARTGHTQLAKRQGSSLVTSHGRARGPASIWQLGGRRSVAARREWQPRLQGCLVWEVRLASRLCAAGCAGSHCCRTSAPKLLRLHTSAALDSCGPSARP